MEIFIVVLFGWLSSLVMSYYLKLLRGASAPWAQDVYAIGSVVPKSAFGGGMPGVMVYLIAGALGAWAYYRLGSEASYTVGSLLGFGLAAGLIRGVVCSLLLTLLAADQGPFQRFFRAGPLPALAHLSGNLLFGISLSLLLGLTGAVNSLAF